MLEYKHYVQETDMSEYRYRMERLIDQLQEENAALKAWAAKLEKECDQWQESNGQMYVRATEAEMREEKLRDRIAILERRLDMGIGHMTLKESGE